MFRSIAIAAFLLAGCAPQSSDDPSGAPSANAAAPAGPKLSLTRLDCGRITIKNFDSFFSDKPGLYEARPRDVVASCYLIRHGDDLMLWDTGLPAAVKGKDVDGGPLVMHLDTTIIDQLAALGIKAEDVDIVGISHDHSDHTGQAADFPQARLIIGTADFKRAQEPAMPGGPNPLLPWTSADAKVEKSSGDVDVFGDGSVTMIHLPGHTPDHHALLVRLASGPVLLSGDLYHALEAREKRGVPPFNTSRRQTLTSMDRFEKLARDSGAKVIIQHEPRDVAKLPAFPKAAQ